jgi:hypothetical protein
VTIKELHQAFEELEKNWNTSNYFNRKRWKKAVAGADIAEFADQ